MPPPGARSRVSDAQLVQASVRVRIASAHNFLVRMPRRGTSKLRAAPAPAGLQPS